MNNITRKNYDFLDPLFFDFFNDRPSYSEYMKTDIKELENSYEMKIELPEIKRENIKLSLDDGYLTVNASLIEKDEEKKEGKYIHKERKYGNFSRSFYVGDEIKEEDIKAKLNDGILTLEIAKVDVSRAEKEKKYIQIQ